MTLAWRIYYSSGLTYSNEDGPPEDAPRLRVQCVVYPDKTVGRVVLHQWDYYVLRDDGVWYGHGGEPSFIIATLLHSHTYRLALAGEVIATDSYNAILDRAANDPDFPRKSANARREGRSV